MTPGPAFPAGSDEFYMAIALETARGGLGWTSPNPLVGCVLVRDGEIIGRGCHERYGEYHAEVNALHDAGDARGATAYVTLEPCTHHGKQPPCCDALATAGVRRVVWGCEDPNPVTAGRARVILGNAGVETGPCVLEGRCREFLDYYLATWEEQRPFMHLKLALSLDGKAACPTGHSQWLSGPEALGYAHFLRLKYDAVLISGRTARYDNPRMTVRADRLEHYLPDHAAPLRQPVRVILDPRFEVMDGLPGLNPADTSGDFRANLPRLLVCGRRDMLPGTTNLPEGCELIGLAERTPTGHLSFFELSQRLWELGIRSVLVEGGPGLAAEALKQQLVDKATLVYTPTMIGGDGLGFTPPQGHQRVSHCPRLTPHHAFVLGNDAVLEGYPVWGITGD